MGGTPAVAAFVVPSLLSPLHIPVEDVEPEPNAEGQFILIEGASLPNSLVPYAKAKDPGQLSTVFGRVLSTHALIQANINVLVLLVNEERPKADNKEGFVQPNAIETLNKNWNNNIPANFQTRQISEDNYNAFTKNDDEKNNVRATNYCFGNEAEFIGIT